jgi:hypothetical protein
MHARPLHRREQRPFITWFIFRWVFGILLVAGIWGVLIDLPDTEDPDVGDETFDLLMGERKAFNVEVNGGGLDYTIDVFSGGPVDVYVSTEGGNPSDRNVAGQVHVNVTTVDEQVDKIHRRTVVIFIDNSDWIGSEPVANATVRTTYRTHPEEWEPRGLGVCSVVLAMGAILMGYSFWVGYRWKRDRGKEDVVTVVELPGIGTKVLIDRRRTSTDPEEWLYRGFLGRNGIALAIVFILLFLGLSVLFQTDSEPNVHLKHYTLDDERYTTYSVWGASRGVMTYEMEVVTGDAVDLLVTSGGHYPEYEVFPGHEHIGVTQVRGTLELGPSTEELSIVLDNTDQLGSPSAGDVAVLLEVTTDPGGSNWFAWLLYALVAFLFLVLLLNLWVARSRSIVSMDTRTLSDGTREVTISGHDVPRGVDRNLRYWLRSPEGPGPSTDLGERSVYDMYMDRERRGGFVLTDRECPRCGHKLAPGNLDNEFFCPTCSWAGSVDGPADL